MNLYYPQKLNIQHQYLPNNNFIAPFSQLVFLLVQIFLETILILYAGHLVFHHLFIEIATPSKSWAQTFTHKILLSTSL